MNETFRLNVLLPSGEEIDTGGGLLELSGVLPPIGAGFYWRDKFYRVKDVFFNSDNSPDLGWWIALEDSSDDPRKAINPTYYR